MRWLRSRTATAILCVVLGVAVWEFGSGAYIYAKAQVGQWLIARAWETSLQTHKPVKPWTWADTFPIGRLVVKELGVDQYVLSGASGRTLAFGPGHYAGTVSPGKKGRAVIAGHRDTHFLFLKNVHVGQAIAFQYRTETWQHFERVFWPICACAEKDAVTARIPRREIRPHSRNHRLLAWI